MSTLTDSQFLHLYLENNEVKLDVYEYPSNVIVSRNAFAPSENAHTYFEQESKRAEEASLLEEPLNDTVDHSELEKRESFKKCPTANTELDSLKNDARCYQFCGSIAHCTDRHCPHCYYVGGACRWQKWCR